MDSILSFLTQHWIGLATTGGLAVAGVWAWPLLGAYEGSYQQGNRLAKRLLKNFEGDFQKLLSEPADSPLRERMQNVQSHVFDGSCGQMAKEYGNQLEVRETRFKNLQAENKQRVETLTAEADAYRAALEKEIVSNEETVTHKNKELMESRRRAESEHMERVRTLEMSEHKKDSLFAGYTRAMKGILARISERVGKNTALYGLLLVAIMLFLGDYYITFNIFNDLLKIDTLPGVTVYIFSGVAALVFVVLLELLIGYLDNNRRQHSTLMPYIIWGTISFICLLLFIAYLLIIVVPVFHGREQQVIDALLRVLFVPLMIGVALVIHQIRSLGGQLSRLIVDPLEAVALIILIPLSWTVSLLEHIWLTIAYTWRRYARASRQPSHIEVALSREIKIFQGQIRIKRKEQAGKSGLFERTLAKFRAEAAKREQQLSQEIKALQEKITQLKRGSNNAVVTYLTVPQ